VLAAYVVETVGTQEYDFSPSEFVKRVEDSYGIGAATDIAPHLT
jgi:adenosine kinase